MRPRNPHPYRAKYVRYYDSSGNRCAKTGHVRREIEESQVWYADLYPAGKRERIPLNTTDLGEAWVELKRLQKEHADLASGLIDTYSLNARKPLSDHVAAWIAALDGQGGDKVRIGLLRSRVTLLVSLAGWERFPDVSVASCRKALGELAGIAPTGKKRGRGPQTRNHYLSHMKQFLQWCLEDRRIREHPLLGLKPVDVETDLRHARRSPTDEEVAALFDYLEGPKARRRGMMSGKQRALGYRLAMATGFRASELRSLRRESFDLEAGTVVVSAGYSKRRRIDTQPLPLWLVEQLREWFASGGGVWDGWAGERPGKVLGKDLKSAGIPYSLTGQDGVKRFFDMHSLRVWYISEVANQPSISMKTLLTLARHSTPHLSLNVYARSRNEDVKRSAGQVREPGKG